MQHIRFKPMLPLLALVLAACSSPTETPVDPKVPPFYSCTQVDARRSADPATGTEAGNAAANWLVQNAQSFGVYYVIWRGQIWYARTGTWEPYDGAGGLYNPSDCSGGHYDHIHVSMY